MAEKKVVLVVVEGQSDKAAFGTIFEEYFENDQVQFYVVKGDITTQDYIEIDQIVKKINDILVMLKSRYGYSFDVDSTDSEDAATSDYLRIIHITDTDGVFVPETLVQESEVCKEDKKVLYFADHIESYYWQSTVERNRRKSQVLIKLSKVNRIHGIPYKIYYNSCNLEHVLFDILDQLTGEEKMELADAFAEKYEGNVDEFIRFISNPDIAVQGNFQQTWKYIYRSNTANSLQRHTNMHLIFE